MFRSFLTLLTLLMGLNASAVLAADIAPDVLARTTTQDVLAILKQDRDITQNGNQGKVYKLVETKILPIFDFNRMTQLVIGKHWSRASAQQKQSLVTEFRNLMVRTYSSSLMAFNNQTVDYKPLSMRPDDTDVTVRSEIRQPGGQPIPINYSMYKTAYGWKVYDVTIDGVSLVTNYRSSFSNTIRQSGIDGLIRTLATQSVRGAKPAGS